MAPLASPASQRPDRRHTSGKDCGTVRPSKRSRWRALSLTLVYVVAAIHVAHWYATGSTLTPVEPSEAMQTLGREALVNAGFIFFVLIILSTLIFGRFFCGWACHVVALQDLCTGLLRKMRIRPKPFRSRLLMLVPLGAAIYMFVLPTVVRLALGQEKLPYRAHLMTSDLWDRFPSWPIALLTFAVCGFLIVYLLGNKGFCTYGCPYGGIFALVDPIASGKIRVTDACEGCGHCTATCTSNVRVHEEVRLHGMVVNSGCMKCMDCIDVCPKGALYFGFGVPALLRGKPRGTVPSRTYDFTWREEAVLAAIFLGSVVVMRGLYDRIPLLLALGLASISAYVIFTGLRLFSVPNVRLAALDLRRQGRFTAWGVVFLSVVTLWTGFLLHSAYVKNLAFRGSRLLAEARGIVAASGGKPSAEAAEKLHRSAALLERGERISLVSMGRLEAGIADAHFDLAEHAEAEKHYRRAIELSPRYPEGRVALARYLAGRGEHEEAVAQLQEAVRIRPETPDACGDLADLLLQLGRAREAGDLLERLVKERPDAESIRVTYGIVLAHLGNVEGGISEIRHVVDAHPEFAEAHLKLGQILANQNRLVEARESFLHAIDAEPRNATPRFMAARLAVVLGRMDEARSHLEVAVRLDPFNEAIAAAWASTLARTGGLAEAIAASEKAAPSDGAERFRLIHLYRAAGRESDAARMEADE